MTRTLEETEEQLAETRAILEEAEASRDEEARKGTAASARLQASEEQLLRAKRERDLLQAERNVWHVARSGIQEEMVKVGKFVKVCGRCTARACCCIYEGIFFGSLTFTKEVTCRAL